MPTFSSHRRFTLAVFAFVVATTTNLPADVIPPANLHQGDKYQLIFITAGTRDATSPYIDDYNAFVTQEAALNPYLPSGVSWRAVASTQNTPANVNVTAYDSIPIYNTHGDRVADGRTQLWSGQLGPPCFDQYGVWSPTEVWTGSLSNGDPFPDFPLGNTTPNNSGNFISLLGGQTVNWLCEVGAVEIFLAPLYGISSPITVTIPEPSTLVLLCTGIAVVLTHVWRRRKRV